MPVGACVVTYTCALRLSAVRKECATANIPHAFSGAWISQNSPVTRVKLAKGYQPRPMSQKNEHPEPSSSPSTRHVIITLPACSTGTSRQGNKSTAAQQQMLADKQVQGIISLPTSELLTDTHICAAYPHCITATVLPTGMRSTARNLWRTRSLSLADAQTAGAATIAHTVTSPLLTPCMAQHNRNGAALPSDVNRCIFLLWLTFCKLT